MKTILKQDNAQVVHFQRDWFFHQINPKYNISFFQTVNILYTNCCKKNQGLYLCLDSFNFFFLEPRISEHSGNNMLRIWGKCCIYFESIDWRINHSDNEKIILDIMLSCFGFIGKILHWSGHEQPVKTTCM